MKFGEVFDYRTAGEAGQFIGKKGVFSDCLRRVGETPSNCFEGTLVKIKKEAAGPFNVAEGYGFQFFRPILFEEAEPLMTNRQLAEWLAKGNGEYSYETSSLTFNYWQYSKGDEDKPVGDYFRIRRWRDTEWSKPIKAIYEEDCIPNTAINKEDCK